MRIDPASLDKAQSYFLMTSCVVPRPIAWVSTVAPDGTLNAAPFSYFQALCSRPPTIVISVGKRRDGRPKDTRANIEASGEFVVNVVSEESGAHMVMTAVGYEPEESEFDKVGLEPAPSEIVKPPRIAECAVALECKLDRMFEIGDSGIIFGRIVMFHVRDDMLTEANTVDAEKLRPLGRLGGTNYQPFRELLSINTEGEVKNDLVQAWRDLAERTKELSDEERAEIRAIATDLFSRL